MKLKTDKYFYQAKQPVGVPLLLLLVCLEVFAWLQALWATKTHCDEGVSAVFNTIIQPGRHTFCAAPFGMATALCRIGRVEKVGAGTKISTQNPVAELAPSSVNINFCKAVAALHGSCPMVGVKSFEGLTQAIYTGGFLRNAKGAGADKSSENPVSACYQNMDAAFPATYRPCKREAHNGIASTAEKNTHSYTLIWSQLRNGKNLHDSQRGIFSSKNRGTVPVANNLLHLLNSDVRDIGFGESRGVDV